MRKIYFAIPLGIAVILLLVPHAIFSGNYTMTVSTDSMVPALKPGDFLVLKKVPIEEIEGGDIIAFDTHQEGVGVIAHRAILVSSGTDGKIAIDTQGDHNDHPDLWTIYDENLIGVVSEVNPPLAGLFSDPFTYSMVAIIVGSAALLGWLSIPRRSIEVKQLTCLRCGNRWHPRIIDGKVKIPETCPDKNCRSPYWRTKPKREMK